MKNGRFSTETLHTCYSYMPQLLKILPKCLPPLFIFLFIKIFNPHFISHRKLALAFFALLHSSCALKANSPKQNGPSEVPFS